MPDLSRVKVGDEVYVVPQSDPSAGYYRKISRVGRRYGYVEMNRYRTEEPFDLATGESHHDPNRNARANRHGFDVYHSREEYLEHVAIAWRVKSHQPAEQDEKSKAWISSLCTDRHHPTCKPVPLMEKYVRILVKPLGTILDPFMGSGTTGVACIKTERQFIGIEKEEKYFTIACERIKRAWQLKKSELPFDPPPPMRQRSLLGES